MHSAFEKVMCFFDKHHKGVFYLTVFLQYYQVCFIHFFIQKNMAMTVRLQIICRQH